MAAVNNEWIEKIKGFMAGEEYLIEKSFPELVSYKLGSIGYEIKESDCWLIAFQIRKVEASILGYCNLEKIPDGLISSAVERVCGSFLREKYNTGDIELCHLDLTGAISSVSAGDTSVSFDNNISDESKFNELLWILESSGKELYRCYRKIKW